LQDLLVEVACKVVGVVKVKRWVSLQWAAVCVGKTDRPIVHTLQVFDMLAFKNDIGFWKNKQNVEGLSIKVHILLSTLHTSHDIQLVVLKANIVSDQAWPDSLS
jgi:Cleft lip and palate transmembrane protein 1 (CLPTM1)